ncbi:MAG: hypothetical protein HYX82_04560 [Chloroflexi bacterium]|nr:hypothetical protein [Chloroflexota bacterium]
MSREYWAAIRVWYKSGGRHHLPWRQNATPWNIMLAETLLHRTRADAIQVLYPRITEEFPGPAAIVKRESEWLEMSRSAGLTWRAVTFVSACKELLAQHGGLVPSEREALLALPGVGHYIASAVRCFGFGIPEVIVDSNTIRLSSRISGRALVASRHRSREVQKAVASLGEVGRPSSPADNYALLDLATKVCRITKPDHWGCPIRATCATGKHVIAGSASTSAT